MPSGLIRSEGACRDQGGKEEQGREACSGGDAHVLPTGPAPERAAGTSRSANPTCASKGRQGVVGHAPGSHSWAGQRVAPVAPSLAVSSFQSEHWQARTAEAERVNKAPLERQLSGHSSHCTQGRRGARGHGLHPAQALLLSSTAGVSPQTHPGTQSHTRMQHGIHKHPAHTHHAPEHPHSSRATQV